MGDQEPRKGISDTWKIVMLVACLLFAYWIFLEAGGGDPQCEDGMIDPSTGEPAYKMCTVVEH